MWGKKLKGHKVLVDANILVSASICYTSKDFGLKHRFYDDCKSLINLFKKKVDKKIGFYTKLIDMTSNRVLSDALLNTIREISQGDSSIDEEPLFEVFSVIYSECLRRLEENKDYLVRETVNESKVTRLMGKVLLFFNMNIKKEIERRNPKPELERAKKIKAKSSMGKIIKTAKIEEARKLCPHYGTLKRKFIESGPGMEDMKLLAEAIYFKDIFSGRKIKFYLTSLDHHFVEIDKHEKVNDLVPSLIKKEFGVECVKPNKILKILK